MDIDFVMCWVDGSDEEWQKKKAFYKGTPYQNTDVRFRDWDILRYWFRAVEEYAPWVNKIYFVTDNQRPAWLNEKHPKLVMVDHTDYIPKKYLPTFNSNTIEVNFHRIEGLSEQFVAFNDDMYINQPVSPEYYFKDGVPCDATLEHVFDGRGYKPGEGWGISVTDYMNTQVLNAHFNRNDVTHKNKKGWYGSYLGLKYQLQAYMIRLFKRTEFQHLYTPHNEKAYLRSTFQEIWNEEPELLEHTCGRFRENTDLNIYLMRYWQLASNKFHPTEVLSKRKVVQLGMNTLNDVERMLFDPKVKSLCLNDSTDCSFEDYKLLKPKIVALFEKKLPNKSSFEK